MVDLHTLFVVSQVDSLLFAVFFFTSLFLVVRLTVSKPFDTFLFVNLYLYSTLIFENLRGGGKVPDLKCSLY